MGVAKYRGITGMWNIEAKSAVYKNTPHQKSIRSKLQLLSVIENNNIN